MARNSYVRSIVLFAVTILTRLPFTSRFLYSQDSVQFALALEKYDVYLHQPHPPGYFLYVMAGKLINHFIQDANASFVLISLLASGLTVVVVYCLGRAVFDERIGWWAGVLAITSPLLWFYGEVALSYSVAAFFNSWIALLCWQALHSDSKRVYFSALLLGIGAGIRQEILIFMFSLWVFCFVNLGWRRVVIALLILGVTVGSWFVPMLVLSGGPDRYFSAVHELWEFHNSRLAIWNVGIAYRKDIILTILGFISYGAGIGAVFILFAFYVSVRTGYWRQIEKEKLVFFTLWFIPGIVFYLVIFLHPYNHGHGLFFLPALLILLPSSVRYVVSEFKGMSRFGNTATSLAVSATLGIVVAVNVGAFLLTDLSYSAKSIREHDRNLLIMLAGIKKTFRTDDTIVLDARSSLFYSFRHVQYYLRDYKVYLGDLRTNKRGETWHIFGGFDGRTFLSDAIRIPANSRYLVYLMDPSDEEYKRDLQSHNLRRLSLENGIVLFYRDIKKDV